LPVRKDQAQRDTAFRARIENPALRVIRKRRGVSPPAAIQDDFSQFHGVEIAWCTNGIHIAEAPEIRKLGKSV
jgi:hypothetical protein